MGGPQVVREGRDEDGQTVFVTKPAGWDTPVDESNFAQFHYHHKPEGTAQDLRFGGLEATGEAPPLRKVRHH